MTLIDSWTPDNFYFYIVQMLQYKFIIFLDHATENLKVFKCPQPKVRDALCFPFPSGSLSIPRPSGNALWNRYWPLIFTFCGLMNCIDDVTSLIKQRLAEGSILFLKTIKVFIELGFHLCKLCLEVVFCFLLYFTL